MPESDAFMLRRLFLSPFTVASYWPEANRQAGNKAANCGERDESEIAKSSLIDILLACSIEKWLDFAGFRIVQEVF